MEEDEEGFLYPHIHSESCINCGLCEKACPIINPIQSKNQKQDAYAVNNKREAVRSVSSSGGVFTLIAEYVLSKNGAVFGAAFNSRFDVEHICIEKTEDIGLLQGSKYVQSRIGSTYEDAKNCLDDGRLVLFTGTPCQIGGLKSYLNKDYDNLICQDIVCHGCPSPMVWRKYVDHLTRKRDLGIQKISFRNKKYGWKNFSVYVQYNDRAEQIKVHHKDAFMRAFLSNLCLRPSCYSCAFKSLVRQGDITLADYWGVSNVHSDMDDDHGTSLVLVNSDKGRELFDAIKEQTICCKTDVQKAIKYNPPAIKSAEKPSSREEFIKSLINNDFQYVNRKYLRMSSKERFDSFKRRLLKKVRRLIR